MECNSDELVCACLPDPYNAVSGVWCFDRGVITCVKRLGPNIPEYPAEYGEKTRHIAHVLQVGV